MIDGQTEVIGYVAELYRKKNIYTKIGVLNKDIHYGNIGPLIKIMILFDSFVDQETISIDKKSY